MGTTRKTNNLAISPESLPMSRGFTLIELMIVVVILGIIAAFAIPAYQENIRRSKRADAKTALADAAARMEQFYLDRKTYTNDMTDLNYMTTGGAPAGTTDSPEGYYRITAVAPAWAAGCFPTTCYELQAVAIDVEQLKDLSCRMFAYDSRGNKTSEDSATAASNNCW